jgi:hypothetical protein
MRTLEQELDWVRREFVKIENFDMRNETHPGGFRLWVEDVIAEEAILLQLMEERERMEKPNERQVGGEHYRKANAKYQHWDLVAEYGMSYYIGNMTKYVCRWRTKGGLADLEKAMHYLEKLISLDGNVEVYRGRKPYSFFSREVFLGAAENFCSSNSLSAAETEIVILSIVYKTKSDLLTIHTKLEELIALAIEEKAKSEA